MNYSQTELDKKKYGVFYTPPEIAQVLSNWSIRKDTDLILEPSFGGCHFLSAAINRFDNLKSAAPKRQLFGCDVDPKAFTYLDNLLGSGANGNFVQNDFLKLTLDNFGINGGVDAVIGNPPYVSHHNLLDGQYEIAQKTLEKYGFTLKGKASLWAYFVLHSMSFMKNGGRMAWVLPSSFLYTDYAEQVKNIIKHHFSKSLIIQIGERLFLSEGTEEISVVVICDDFNKNDIHNGSMDIIFVEEAQDIENTIINWESRKTRINSYKANATLSMLSEETLYSYNTLSARSNTKDMGDFFDIQIGIVSGANKFFIISDKIAQTKNLPKDSLVPILTKFRYIKGLTLTLEDFKRQKKKNKSYLLVDTTSTETISGSLKEYLESFPEDKIKKITTFQRRMKSGKPWHQFNDNRIPDAFFPYMLKDGPYIVLNQAKVNSTNSVHRLYLKQAISKAELKSIAISLLSIFSQLSAEIEGRAYGAGVLKHEPSETSRIKFLMPSGFSRKEVNNIFDMVNELIYFGEYDKAQTVANNFVMKDFPESEKRLHVNNLALALSDIRKQRLPNGGK